MEPVETRPRTSATVFALTATLGLAAVSWVVAVRQMRNGMDMGVATQFGSFTTFLALWVSMMAAMMLPTAAPAAVSRARTGGARSVPLFIGAYLAVWTFVGLVVYVAYRPPGSLAAGAVVIAVGVYELTPLKGYFRRRCRDNPRSGIQFGLHCVGSSLGLMLVLVVLGIMNIALMSVIAVLCLGQKLLSAKASVDVPLALAIVGIGILILCAPSSIPGLTPMM